jgi:O-antigen/teichoic acid export membrane protein
MSLSRRIFYNTLAQSLGKVFAALIGLVTISVLSQYLREQGFGQYSTVVAFLGFFAVLADFGLYLYVVREISKPQTDHFRILSNALGLRLTAALSTLLLGALLALLFPYDAVVKRTMFLGILAFVSVSLNQVFVGVFQKHLVQHLVVFSETIGRAVNLLLVYAFIKGALGVPFFILALMIGSGANLLMTWLFAKRYEKFGIAFEIKVWKEILLVSWPLIFAVFLNLLYFKTDTVILSLFHPPETVGIYSLPYKLLEGLLAFPAMFVGLVMPLLSKTAFSDWGKFKMILQHAFNALVLMAILVILTFVCFSQKIIELVKIVARLSLPSRQVLGILSTTQSYADSPALLQILVLSAGTIFLGTLFGYAVVAINQQKAMIKGYALSAVIGLAWYFALIPRFGYWAAAWGTLLTEIIACAYAYYLVRKTSGQKLSWKIIYPALPAAGLMLSFFLLVSLPWILEVILGGLIYIFALIAFKAIPWQFVKEIIFIK